MPPDSFQPPEWNDRECLKRMIRGAIRKATSLERDGALTAGSSQKIRHALAAAVLRVEDARWYRRAPEDGVQVLDRVEQKPEPLPTEVQSDPVFRWPIR